MWRGSASLRIRCSEKVGLVFVNNPDRGSVVKRSVSRLHPSTGQSLRTGLVSCSVVSSNKRQTATAGAKKASGVSLAPETNPSQKSFISIPLVLSFDRLRRELILAIAVKHFTFCCRGVCRLLVLFFPCMAFSLRINKNQKCSWSPGKIFFSSPDSRATASSFVRYGRAALEARYW